jgi:hypothetical protein
VEHRKFRYIITDLYNGCVVGTDDAEVAKSLSNVDEYFVVDTETGSWITGEEPLEIEEYKE